ncbi:hypothetical protein GCM10020221_14870 [Streptomyces thioluteus]|uniref:Uncharacterized protein n=1 Tax=Streptomyces thioluteus TaxID=66431 RepID=A0ABN3WM29_STRTU
MMTRIVTFPPLEAGCETCRAQGQEIITALFDGAVPTARRACQTLTNHLLQAHGYVVPPAPIPEGAAPAKGDRPLFRPDCLVCTLNIRSHFSASVQGNLGYAKVMQRLQAQHCLTMHGEAP